MKYIMTEDGQKLTDGDVVMLQRFPGTKWVVHNGWYTYQCQQMSGWYFSSIPAQTTLPITEEDLCMLTILSGEGPCPIPPGHHHECCPPPNHHHHNHHPAPVPFTPEMARAINAAFITVDTIEQRDRLNFHCIPDGKLVRVNNVRGKVKYYSYNLENRVWEEENFGQVKGEDFEELQSRVESIENDIQWLDIKKEVIE